MPKIETVAKKILKVNNFITVVEMVVATLIFGFVGIICLIKGDEFLIFGFVGLGLFLVLLLYSCFYFKRQAKKERITD